MITINIQGRDYPCEITMGAMLRFKRETGREAQEMGKDSISDLITYLWCCTASACNRDGVEFGLSLTDFADSLTPDQINGYFDRLGGASQAAAATAPKKKTSRKA